MDRPVAEGQERVGRQFAGQRDRDEHRDGGPEVPPDEPAAARERRPHAAALDLDHRPGQREPGERDHPGIDQLIAGAPDIRRRILFVLGMLVVYRALAVVPVPGVDSHDAVANLVEQQPSCSCSTCSRGGGLASFSIVAMGVNPYINASIIMQLMTGVVPRLQALSREGEYGRNKINQYTRYLTVPLALLQAYGYLAILSDGSGIVTDFDILSA